MSHRRATALSCVSPLVGAGHAFKRTCERNLVCRAHDQRSGARRAVSNSQRDGSPRSSVARLARDPCDACRRCGPCSFKRSGGRWRWSGRATMRHDACRSKIARRSFLLLSARAISARIHPNRGRSALSLDRRASRSRTLCGRVGTQSDRHVDAERFATDAERILASQSSAAVRRRETLCDLVGLLRFVGSVRWTFL